MKINPVAIIMLGISLALASWPCVARAAKAGAASAGDLTTSGSLAMAGHKGILSDRIVAWVDSEAITLSELEEALVRYQAQGELPEGPIDEQSLRSALDLWVDETLIILAARKAKIEVPTETIDNRVDNMIRQMEVQRGGPEGLDALLKNAGKDRDALRNKLREQLRREYTIVRAVNTRFAVTEADVAKFSADRRAKAQPTETLNLYQVFFPISRTALPERWTRVTNLAHDLRMKTAEKGKFEATAEEWVRAHPDEGAEIGPLGEMNTSELIPVLASAVTGLEEGQSTPPVRTEKGIQILYVQRKTTARQILIAKRYAEERAKWVKELHNGANIQIIEPIAAE